MFRLAVTLLAAALVAPSVHAQASACISNCIANALAPAGCAGVEDLACICSSEAFLGAASTCVQTDCPTELEAAIELQTATCAEYAAGETDTTAAPGGTGSPSSAAPSSTPVPPSSSGASSSTPRPASSSSAAPASSSSSSTGAAFHQAGVASGVTLALFGAAFSLF